MGRLWRALWIIIAVYATLMAVMGLQYLFDRGDLRKASQVIESFRPDGKDGPSLKEKIARGWGVVPSQVDCRYTLISRYEGKVKVACSPRNGRDQDARAASWEVDLVAGQVSNKKH